MAQPSATTANGNSAARLLELIQMRLIAEAIYVVAALGIPDLLAPAPKSSEQLAEITGVNAPYLHRVMRALSSFGIFREEGASGFALAPMGELLQRNVDGSLHSAAMLYGGAGGAQMLSLFLECVTRGECASQIRFGNWTNWIQSDPELLGHFNAMMTAYSKIHATGLFDAYDFSFARKLVDIGGGHGRILTEILKRHPQMHGVLFDMPHALQGGQKTIAEAGVADRCEAVSGDFFVSVPAGGDLYMLSRVIHDWNDEKSIAILKVVRDAITPDGRLILLETMLRPAGECIYPVLSDLNMLIRTGGLERTESEYRALYQAAGFELSRAIATTAPTGTTVIEGRPI